MSDELKIVELMDQGRLANVAPDIRRNLLRALMESLADEVAPNPDEEMVDIVPLDSSLECEKNEKTGVLYIVTVTAVAGRRDRPTRMMYRKIEVKPDAQQFLLRVFQESIAEDAAAGRLPPSLTKLQ